MKVRIKQHKCRICRTMFLQLSMGHVVCSLPCVIEYTTRNRAKADKVKRTEERKDIAKRKEAIKTRSEWLKTAQVAFNAYIRERDKDQACICCHRFGQGWSRGGEWDAGHYRSVGSAPHLRFDERNVHRQLKQCNSYGAGRAVDYRIGLIQRIGLEAVESLEADNEAKKWTIEQLRELIAEHRAKLKLIREM